MSGFLQSGGPPLILASSSKVRARLLGGGPRLIVEGPGLHEHAMRQVDQQHGLFDPQDLPRRWPVPRLRR